MEQVVEVGARRRGVRQPEEALHAIPERIGVEHEARARHDVGPVAGLVLLQQEEALVLLRAEPAQARARPRVDNGASSRASPSRLPSVLVEQGEGDQPPQRGVDAAQVPEVGFAAVPASTNFGIWPLAA